MADIVRPFIVSLAAKKVRWIYNGFDIFFAAYAAEAKKLPTV